jgi:spermidine/putrescine transport system ATP-binding protein
MVDQIRGEPVGVELTRVAKSYGAVPAVRGVSLAIEPGEIVSLLGPSGCGKTTTLRIVAGLERPDAGEIRIGRALVNTLPPWKRNIGMVFQSYALFPHMTVAENVAFGLRMRGVAGATMDQEVAAALAQVRLGGFGERRPSELSGGQRQRVALARAIVTRPSVLLLDEPLAALDRQLRESMQIEIREIQRAVGITAIFVTHDQEEALTLSDRVVVMEDGRIVQSGTPAEIYERPRTRFVSDFVGFSNVLNGRVAEGGRELGTVTLTAGRLVPVSLAPDIAPGDEVDVVVRPEKVWVAAAHEAVPTAGHAFPGTITHSVYMGALTYHHVAVEGVGRVVAMVPNVEPATSGTLAVGSAVLVGWRPESALAFRRNDPGARAAS